MVTVIFENIAIGVYGLAFLSGLFTAIVNVIVVLEFISFVLIKLIELIVHKKITISKDEVYEKLIIAVNDINEAIINLG